MPPQLQHSARLLSAIIGLWLLGFAHGPGASGTGAAFADEAEGNDTVDVKKFGAVGDGVADDTAAIQKAIASLSEGDTLVFPSPGMYRHTDVLSVGTPRVRITGAGTLLATNEERSCFHINADDITVDGGLAFKMDATSKRWDAYEQMKLRLSGHTGIVLRNITVDGSAAAGIYIGNGCSDYLLEDVTVLNARADGIHNTGAAHDGVIRRPIIRNVGDDGVAVVSYSKDGEGNPCRNITIESPRFYGNVWGRGYSVVGGEDITFRDVYAENSNAAAIYIACEGEPWYTFASKRIRVLGGELRRSNVSTTVDHGAVLIYSGRPGYANEDIEVANLKIIETRPTASRQVGILGEAARVELRDFVFAGGPGNLFSTNVPDGHYNLIDWTLCLPQKDHVGFR